MTLLDAALAFHQAGLAIIPTATNGSKAPAVPWKKYQDTPPTVAQLTTWFGTDTYDGLGAITGPVSGNLVLFEFEGRAAHLLPAFAKRMADNDAGDLWDRLTSGGYVEATPSGGIHIYYHVAGEPGRNTKLARRPATDAELAENPDEKTKVLIETRGTGGFSVMAPSSGRTHPTGKPWTALMGSPTTIPTITVDEQDTLFVIAGWFDHMPSHDVAFAATNAPQARADGSLRPGDDYNERATWEDILVPKGWTLAKRFGAGYGWTRPGKDARAGISATTGTAADGVDRLYVFSSSTEFDTETPYSKFAAYTLLEHGGDYAAAAKQLGKQGYGTPATQLGPDTLLEGMTTWPTTLAPLPSTESTSGSTNPESGTSTTSVSTAAPSPRPVRKAEPNQDNTALVLVDLHAHEVRFCPERGQWLAWSGRRWQWDEGSTIIEHARILARRLPTTEGWATYTKSALTMRGISGTLGLAAADPRIVVHAAKFDAQPYELNTPAGIVDLRTGEMLPSDPVRMHTKITPYAPNLAQPTPMWNKFLAETFAGDPDLAIYMQRMLGVSLVGAVIEQTLPLAYGSGKNGKSVLFETIQGAVGMSPDGYATSIAADMLTTKNNNDHPATIAQLQGVRIAIGGEVEEGAHFAESKIKMLTGGDPINARFMGKNPFTFKPTHSLWLHANHLPDVRAGGPAFWRRIRQIPFLHTVPEEDRIKDLSAVMLDKEGPGILAWLIQGAADYHTLGLAEAASVTDATAGYQHDSDTIAQFVEERCETGNPAAQHMHVRTTEVRTHYEAWCRAEGLEAVSAKALTQQLRARYGVQQSRSATARFYDGIRLNDVPTSETTSEGPSDIDRSDRGGW